MPQSSIAYAVGRVRAAARKPLGEAQLERLLASADYEEALRLLGEMGWAREQGTDIDRLSVSMLEDVCRQLRAITPDSELTDSFLLRHDAQNLKALFKARVLGTSPEGLSGCGTIPLDTLRHAVTEHVYKKLPPAFEAVMEALEKRVALSVNPMQIDVMLDQALYTEIARRMKTAKSEAAKAYFKGKADLGNAVAYLRLEAMHTQGVRLQDILLPGGDLSRETWQEIARNPEKLAPAFSAYGPALVKAIRNAQQDFKQVPALEKAADDYLLALFRPLRNEPFRVEVLLGWLLAHEREAAAVRLIMAGKLNGFPPEVIRERLRDAYGR